jgi:hypothetical protein
MSVQIQLETGYLDVKEGTAFPLNFGVADIRDVSKRSGAFSKTITLTGTANNHNLLNHYYDVNIQAGTFNINTLTRCSVIQNGLPVLESGYLQLIAVNKVQTTVDYENEVEYEVLVKDESSDFFTKLGNKELTDLDFTDLNHEYRAINVVNSFVNTQTDGYKYLVPFKDSNEYLLQDMKPAIYAKTYFDRIFSQAGFSYTWSTLTAAHFDKLIIPFNGEKSLIDYSTYLVEADNAVTLSGPNSTFTQILDGWTEVTDAQTLFDPTTGTYTPPFNLLGGDNVSLQITFNADVNLVNTSASTAYYVDMTSSIFSYESFYGPRLIIEKNGNFLTNVAIIAPPIIVNEGDTLTVGTNTIGNFDITVTVLIGNAILTDAINILGGLGINLNTNLQWLDGPTTAGNPVTITSEIVFNSINIKLLPSSSIVGYGAVIDMNNSVPNKVKQADFIKSLFTMYNLYTEQDPDVANNLVLKHRDDYYDQGVEVDWTYKLAKDKDQALQFLPELSAKKLILTYKNDSDDPNKIYFEATKEIYGQLEFIFTNEYVKGVDTKEITFSPTPIALSTFNAYLPTLSGQPKTNIRILHDCGVGTCDSYNIYNYGNTGEIGVTTYPILHHWDDPINPTFDILFGQPDYMFYGGYNVTNNNLYNLYWRRTVNQINVGKMLTAYFDLREDDIQKLKLNDKIRIDNSWWTINKVIDYNCNAQMLTKVELMSVDTEIDLAPFAKGSVTPTTVGDLASHTGSIHWDNQFTGNVIPGTSTSAIYGQGNVIQPNVNGIIVGNNKILDQTGIATERIVADYGEFTTLKFLGGMRLPVTTVTADYYLTPNDYLIQSNTAGTLEIYLPNATLETRGQIYIVKANLTGSILTNVNQFGTDTIDGTTFPATIANGQTITLVSDGNNNWITVF